MNFFRARVVSSETGSEARFADAILPLPNDHAAASKGEVVLGVRPEHLTIGNPKDGGLAFQATIETVEHLGAETLVELSAEGSPLIVKSGRLENLAPDQKVTVSATDQNILLFDADDGQRLRGPGQGSA